MVEIKEDIQQLGTHLDLNMAVSDGICKQLSAKTNPKKHLNQSGLNFTTFEFLTFGFANLQLVLNSIGYHPCKIQTGAKLLNTRSIRL